MASSKSSLPPQHQDRKPGLESEMNPPPVYEDEHYAGAGRLTDKVALITGGDSGIGRAVAIAFAKEGADLLIAYYDEHDDAAVTRQRVEALGRRCVCAAGDIRDEAWCGELVRRTLDTFGRLDILVNNASDQTVQDNFLDITSEQFEQTFRTNVFGMFYLTRAALPHMREGACIINTSSTNAYRGSKHLVDYSATKGAIVAFTRSLALNLVDKGIRVNAVAPGPVWTPLVPASFPADEVPDFGHQTPMQRSGQPVEIAGAYVLLASSTPEPSCGAAGALAPLILLLGPHEDQRQRTRDDDEADIDAEQQQAVEALERSLRQEGDGSSRDGRDQRQGRDHADQRIGLLLDHRDGARHPGGHGGEHAVPAGAHALLQEGLVEQVGLRRDDAGDVEDPGRQGGEGHGDKQAGHGRRHAMYRHPQPPADQGERHQLQRRESRRDHHRADQDRHRVGQQRNRGQYAGHRHQDQIGW